MRLKFGMVGGGNGAFIGNVHRHGAVMDDLAELVSGCFSRTMEKNLETAQKWGISDSARVYGDYREMAEKEEKREDGIDFVSITTPNDTHYPIAKCFLEHGIPVMCDKPLALTVKEGEELSVGKHTLQFFMAPMVHWPEVMVTYDQCSKVLFSADGFGSFGALNGILFNDEVNFDRDWIDDARRYYTNIVGKYGSQMQGLLKKMAALDIQIICPLHGPVWRSNLDYLLGKHQKWSTYESEEKGVLIAYASMYGNTQNMAEVLAGELAEAGITNTSMYDVSGTHYSYVIADAFKYTNIVLATPTYNGDIYPVMQQLLDDMKALNVQNKTVAIMENGSWGPTAAKKIKESLENMKNMTILENTVTIKSSMKIGDRASVKALAAKIVETL